MEIELKFVCKKLDEIEKKLTELGATLKGEKQQIDVYFDHPSRVLVATNEYLRIRTQGDKSELHYHIARSATTGFNEEHEVEIGDGKEIGSILKMLGFKQLGIIDKQRRKYILNGSEICLDRVKDVGDYVEVEVDGEDEKSGKEKCWEVAKSLGLTEAERTDNLLCDIAVGKSKVYNK